MARGVHIVKFNAAGLGVIDRKDLRRTVKPRLIDVGDDEPSRPVFRAMQREVNRAQTHRACTREDDHRAALLDAHLVVIFACLEVVAAPVCPHDAGYRLGDRRFVIGVTVIRQQTVEFQHLFGDDDTRGITADPAERVARRPVLVAGDVELGLDPVLLADTKFVLPVLADLQELAAKLVAEDDGILRDIVGNPLVVGALDRCLVIRHADAVRDNVRQDFIIGECRQVKPLKPQVVLAI